MDFKAYYKYHIRTYQTDAKQRLFMHQIFNLFQDAAHRHANTLGFGMLQLQQQQLFWVLSRLTVQIEALPAHDDEVNLSTWVKSYGGAKSEREFTISLGDKVLVRASSLWLCLAASSHRPATIPQQFSDLMQPVNEYAVADGANKVILPAEERPYSAGHRMQAHYSDIDLADHVNNAVYVRWIMDETRQLYPDAEVREFTINYLDEAFGGDEVSIFHIKEGAKQLFHQVFKQDSANPICRSQIIFG